MGQRKETWRNKRKTTNKVEFYVGRFKSNLLVYGRPKKTDRERGFQERLT